MDKKFRLFGKVGLLDILILLLVVAAALVFVRVSGSTAALVGGGDSVPITYVVELSRKPRGFEENVTAGDKLYDNLKGYYIREITGVQVIPYKSMVMDRVNGRWAESELPGESTILVTVTAGASVSESATMVGDAEISVGTEMFIRSRGFASSGYCVSLQK